MRLSGNEVLTYHLFTAMPPSPMVLKICLHSAKNGIDHGNLLERERERAFRLLPKPGKTHYNTREDKVMNVIGVGAQMPDGKWLSGFLFVFLFIV